MSDIVERLRNHALPDPNDEREVIHAPLLREAAEDLERLRLECERAWGEVDLVTKNMERLRAELSKTKAELDLRVKSGSPVDRLHNICRALADEADGSAWSREEWERLDNENVALQKHVERLGHDLNAAKAVIRNIVESEVEPLKALLRELLPYVEEWHTPSEEHAERIRAALGDNPTS